MLKIMPKILLSQLFLFALFANLFGTPSSSKNPREFWKILMNLGKNSPTQKEDASEVLEELIRYGKASLYYRKLGPKAKIYQKIYDRQFSTFALGDMYKTLPFGLKNSKWKGSHHYEKMDKGKLYVTLGKPDLAQWIRFKNPSKKAPWKEVHNLGDSDQRFYVSPVQTNSGSLHYKAYFFERMGLGKVHPTRILYGLKALLTYLEVGVRNVPTSFHATLQQKKEFPTLSRGELFVMTIFASDFPQVYKKITRYIEIKSLSTPLKFKGVEYCRFNLQVGLKMDGIQKDFPSIYQYLKKLHGFFELKSRMYDEKGRFVGFLRFSSSNFTFHFSYAMKNGRFLPCSTPWEPVNFTGFSPLDLGKQKNTFRNDIQIKANGVRMVIRNLKLQQEYFRTSKTNRITFHMREAPMIQKIDGRAYGIFPVWLIDLIIPSNIEGLLKKFFQVLGKGRNGEGWLLKLESIIQKDQNRIELSTASEMLSNGVIRIGMKITSDLLLPNKKTSQEFTNLSKVFWHAFVSDYFRFRYPD